MHCVNANGDYYLPSQSREDSSLEEQKITKKQFEEVEKLLQSIEEEFTHENLKELIGQGIYSILQYWLSNQNVYRFNDYNYLLEDPNRLLGYDQNGQSQLLTCLKGCLDKSDEKKIDLKPFEFLLKLLYNSNQNNASIREHMTNVFEVVFVWLPEKVPRQYIFQEFVEFLAEQKIAAGLRQVVNDPNLANLSNNVHTSEYKMLDLVDRTVYSKEKDKSQKDKDLEQIVKIIDDFQKNQEETNCCENKNDYEVSNSFVDFRSL